MLERVGEFLHDCVGEIASELARKIRIVWHVRLDQRRIERELRIGEQDGELRPRERLRTPSALHDFLVVGQELDAAVEFASGFARLYQPLLEADVIETTLLGD